MRKRLIGTVLSDRMDKTRVVVVERIKRHPRYQKEMVVRKRYKIHDPGNETHIGDKILIEECRPLSKEKRWRLVRILKTGGEIE